MDNDKKNNKNGSHSKDEGHHSDMARDFRIRFIVSTIISVPVLLLSPLIQGFLGIEGFLSFNGDSYLVFGLSAFIFFYGGWPFLKGLFKEIRSKQPGMMTLIALAITVAFVYSSAVVFGLEGKYFFWELVTLIDIMLLGHWIEMRSVRGASRALDELAKLMPSEAHLVDEDGNTRDVKVEELTPDDKVLVKPGEKFPTDGVIIEGSTSVNEALLTGESKPVEKKEDDEVIGGSINGEGSVTVSVDKDKENSFLSGVMKLVEEAQKSKSRARDIANKAAFWLTIIAISVGVITLFVWLFAVGRDFTYSIERTVTVMVITCPHALGLAVPLVIAVSTALSAKNGLLIRNRSAFERARKIDTVIFDKTGTLTLGKFGVSDVMPLKGDLEKEEILKYAASLESKSEHPIAKGISEASEERFEVKDFKSMTGKGVQAKIDGKDVKIVSPSYLEENSLEVDDEKTGDLSTEGKTIVYLLIDGEVQAAIALADIIRDEAKETIARLKEMDIDTKMITGDNDNVAKWVADNLGIDEYFAEVLPEDKVDIVKKIQARGKVTVMTGDGVNDAPALAQADIGIAIGAGTDVAIETADIILVKSNPRDVLHVVDLSKATYRKMLQNLGWATGYNLIAIPLAAGVLFPLGIVLSPAVGAILMSLSTVIVAINSRFLKLKNPDNTN